MKNTKITRDDILKMEGRAFYSVRKGAHVSSFGNTVKKTVSKNKKKYTRKEKHKKNHMIRKYDSFCF